MGEQPTRIIIETCIEYQQPRFLIHECMCVFPLPRRILVAASNYYNTPASSWEKNQKYFENIFNRYF